MCCELLAADMLFRLATQLRYPSAPRTAWLVSAALSSVVLMLCAAVVYLRTVPPRSVGAAVMPYEVLAAFFQLSALLRLLQAWLLLRVHTSLTMHRVAAVALLLGVLTQLVRLWHAGGDGSSARLLACGVLLLDALGFVAAFCPALLMLDENFKAVQMLPSVATCSTMLHSSLQLLFGVFVCVVVCLPLVLENFAWDQVCARLLATSQPNSWSAIAATAMTRDGSDDFAALHDAPLDGWTRVQLGALAIAVAQRRRPTTLEVSVPAALSARLERLTVATGMTLHGAADDEDETDGWSMAVGTVTRLAARCCDIPSLRYHAISRSHAMQTHIGAGFSIGGSSLYSIVTR